MRVGSAGRQKDRAGTKYKLTSLYIIYDKPCMYIQDERLVGRSAGRQVGTYPDLELNIDLHIYIYYK